MPVSPRKRPILSWSRSPAAFGKSTKVADGTCRTAVTRCGDAMYGPEFLAEMTKRYRVAEFSLVEHLRWLASTLSSKERADAVRNLVEKIRKPVNTTDPLGVPAKDIDVITEGPSPTTAASSAASTPVLVPEEPFKVAPGVIHVEAESFTDSFAEPAYPAEQKGTVYVYDCFTGGKQVNFQRNMKISWVDYVIDVPETGTCGMEVMLAAANRDQVLDVS